MLDMTVKYGISGCYDQSHGISLQHNLNNILNWAKKVGLNQLVNDALAPAIQVSDLLASVPQHLFQVI